jgi:hypothetical protein
LIAPGRSSWASTSQVVRVSTGANLAASANNAIAAAFALAGVSRTPGQRIVMLRTRVDFRLRDQGLSEVRSIATFVPMKRKASPRKSRVRPVRFERNIASHKVRPSADDNCTEKLGRRNPR